jgi:hypothetical protein
MALENSLSEKGFSLIFSMEAGAASIFFCPSTPIISAGSLKALLEVSGISVAAIFF